MSVSAMQGGHKNTLCHRVVINTFKVSIMMITLITLAY